MGAIDFSREATTAHIPILALQVICDSEDRLASVTFPFQRVFFELDTAGTGLSGPNRPSK